MILSNQGLQLLLAEHVVELAFLRRHKKAGWNQTRRMLCTNNWHLLNSIPGKITLKYKPPQRRPKYNPAAYNLVTAWDIFWQDYRNISLDSYQVLAALPVKTEQDIAKFWEFFANVIYNLSPQDKIKFMNGKRL